jgi:hypothetical protein
MHPSTRSGVFKWIPYSRVRGEGIRSYLESDFVLLVLVLSETVLVIVIDWRQPRRNPFSTLIDSAFIELKSKPVWMVALPSTT